MQKRPACPPRSTRGASLSAMVFRSILFEELLELQMAGRFEKQTRDAALIERPLGFDAPPTRLRRHPWTKMFGK